MIAVSIKTKELVYHHHPTSASDIMPSLANSTAAGNVYFCFLWRTGNPDGEHEARCRSLCATDISLHVLLSVISTCSWSSWILMNHRNNVLWTPLAGPIDPCGKWGSDILTAPAGHGLVCHEISRLIQSSAVQRESVIQWTKPLPGESVCEHICSHYSLSFLCIPSIIIM